MEDLLNLDFFNLSPQLIKIITFLWNITKCSIIFLIALKLLRFFNKKLTKVIEGNVEHHEQQQQFLTLKTLVFHTLQGIFITIYGMNMLFLFGIDVRPLLATAGVLGVAIGFGAKRTVEDVLSGLMIILEGQIRVGDYVDIEGAVGFVEKITLPLITVRAIDTGAVHFIRCGYIDKIINHTMHYSYAFFALDVGYEQNVDNVFRVIRKSFEILMQNEELASKILSKEIEIFGLSEFKESSLCIQCRIKTQPKEQWTIQRAFNKIIKEQFDIENIEIPFNQIVVSKK